MIKNLAISLPALGRVSIGETVVSKGRRLPSKLDEFRITTLAKDMAGGWERHDLDTVLRGNGHNEKLTAIPIKLITDNPDSCLSSSYTAFDRIKGRPVCVGNGDTALRIDATTGRKDSVSCPGSDYCSFGQSDSVRCRLMSRFSFQIDGQDDPFGLFVLRTTGFNSTTALKSKLEIYKALTGRLAGLKFKLTLRKKTSPQSMGQPFFFVDLIGPTPEEARKQVEDHALHIKDVEQQRIDNAITEMMLNGKFAETSEDGDLVEEFGVLDDNVVVTANQSTVSEGGVSDEVEKEESSMPPILAEPSTDLVPSRLMVTMGEDLFNSPHGSTDRPPDAFVVADQPLTAGAAMQRLIESLGLPK